MQPDPIGLAGGWNRFNYVGGNALSHVDSTGLQTDGWNRRIQPYSVPHPTADAQRDLARRLTRGGNNFFDACKGIADRMFSEGEDNSDEAVQELTDGLTPETDIRGRPVREHYINGAGDAQTDLDAMPGTTGPNGQRVLPDGSVAEVHISTTTGAATLHINRPIGSQDIKIRYPTSNP
jgi:hypothetical protein